MKRYRLFNLFVVLAILAGLLGAQPVFADGPVTAQLSYFTVNDGTAFSRSLSPQSIPVVGGGTASQTANPDGSVTVSIDSVSSYADAGFYIPIGELGDLKGTLVRGSGDFAVNLWFDKDNDGEYFAWDGGGVLTGLGGDAYILGVGAQNGIIAITDATQFTSLQPGGGNFTLVQLKSGAASGIDATTTAALWIGTCCTGSKSGTIDLIHVVIDPVEEVFVDDDFDLEVAAASGYLYGVDAFDTVQAGVNAVSGSTINVADGTYVEQVEITKTLTLQGNGPGTVIQSPDSLTLFFSTSAANKPIVYVHDTTGVTIEGLVVDGAGKGNANPRFIGIGFHNADGTISHVEIKDVRNTPFSGAQHGVALYNWSDDGQPHSLTVVSSNFHGFQKNAMALNADSSTPLAVDVHGNTIAGYGATDITAQNGVQVWADLGTGTVMSNTITGIGYDNTASATKWVASSILSYYADLDITDNTVSEGHAEIYNIDGAGLIARNQLSVEKIGVSGYGIIATDPPDAVPEPFDAVPGMVTMAESQIAATAILNNEVADNEITFTGENNTNTYGIEADAGYGPNDLSINVHHNIVTGFDVGIEIAECQEDCSTGVFTTILANYNSISGNNIGLRSNWGSLTGATLNWWGSSSGPTNINNPSGSGTAVVGNAGFTPWLCDGADTGPEIGFQPNETWLCPSSTPATITITEPVSGTEICLSGPTMVSVELKDSSNNPVPNHWIGVYASGGTLEQPAGTLVAQSELAPQKAVELLTAEVQATLAEVGVAEPIGAACLTGSDGACSLIWTPDEVGPGWLLATAGEIFTEAEPHQVNYCTPGGPIFLPIVVKNSGGGLYVPKD